MLLKNDKLIHCLDAVTENLKIIIFFLEKENCFTLGNAKKIL